MSRALLLGFVALCLVACTSAARQKAADDARAAVNKYCDARQKVIEALGVDGSAAIGLAGAPSE